MHVYCYLKHSCISGKNVGFSRETWVYLIVPSSQIHGHGAVSIQVKTDWQAGFLLQLVDGVCTR